MTVTDDRLAEMFDWNGRMCPKYKLCYDEDGDDYIELTDQWRAFRQQHAVLSKLEGMSLTEDCLKYGFHTYTGVDVSGNIPKLRKYADEFTTRYSHIHLYLWSKANSTQKSTMAKALIVELLKQGVPCDFVLMSELLKMLIDESFKPEYAERLETLRRARFLVVDDSFDPQKATVFKSGYQFAFLDTFLRQRLEVEKKATCFTSNVPLSDIEKSWTTSIYKLMVRSIPDPMQFSDSLTDFSAKDLWS